jgi:site-specific recombinase
VNASLRAAIDRLDSTKPLIEREQALERFVGWLRAPRRLDPDEMRAHYHRPQHARLDLLLDTLEADPAARERVMGTLASVLRETSAVHLLAEVGVPSDRGFLHETADRLEQKLLPRARREGDLADAFSRSLPKKHDAGWLADLPVDLVDRLVALLPEDARAALWHALADAIRLLAARVSGLGLSEELRERSSEGHVDESPFYRLPRVCDALVAGTASSGEVHDVAEQCRGELGVVHDHLERAGVSVDLVYRMDAIGHCLGRLEALLPFVDANLEPGQRHRHVPALLSTLVLARIGDLSLARLFRESTRLLARKVIERVGTTGEHYITATRGEWWKMLGSAGGGGVLTAGTAAGKFLIVWMKLPVLIEGILVACDYAGSFLLMQFMGFTLATKQPSMTAAALADAWRSADAAHRVDDVVSMIARMTRSQLAAAIGNVGLVIPAAIGLELWHRSLYGRSFLDEKAAAYVIHSLDVTEPSTIWFASLTGLFLWMASLGAGWLENWAVYRRLPDAIEQHRLGRVVGRRTMRYFSGVFRRQVAGAGGSISLGALLAFMPMIGKGFGIPIDVRHVTLSAGSLTLAGCALGWHHVRDPHFIAAAIGVLVIGVLNFVVSFLLALMVAMRGHGVGMTTIWAVARRLVARVLRRPFEFIYPPAGVAPTTPHH